jgi:hypothetical protein
MYIVLYTYIYICMYVYIYIYIYRNLATHEQIKNKEEKNLLKSIDSLPRHLMEQESEEKRIADMKLMREVLNIFSYIYTYVYIYIYS